MILDALVTLLFSAACGLAVAALLLIVLGLL